MGRWVRWFGSPETGEADEAVGEERPRRAAGGGGVASVSAASAREIARDGGPRFGAPAPTGAMSLEKMAGEMLTAVLVKDGVLSQADEHAALTEHRTTGRPVEDVIIEQGYMEESGLIAALSRRCKVPHFRLERYQVRAEVLEAVPAEFARANRIVPVERLGKMLNVATSNPLDVGMLKRLEEEVGLKVKPVLASPRELESTVDRLYPPALDSGGEEEERELSATQVIKASWLGLVGNEKAEEAAVRGETSPAPSAPEDPITVGAEKAIRLGDDDALSGLSRSTSASLWRSWERSVGTGGGPMRGDRATGWEFSVLAGDEPLSKAPAPKPKKKAKSRAKSKPKKSKRAKKGRKKRKSKR